MIVLAYFLGRSERNRLARSGRTLEQVAAGADPGRRSAPARARQRRRCHRARRRPHRTAADDDARHGQRPGPEPADPAPKLIWFNLGLTVTLLILLGLDLLPLSLVFVAATAIALVVNFPNPDDQVTQIKAHASSIVSVVAMVFAAAVLVGVLSGSGMVTAMANGIVAAVPEPLGPWFAVITALLSHAADLLPDQRRVLLRHPADPHRGRRALRHRAGGRWPRPRSSASRCT